MTGKGFTIESRKGVAVMRHVAPGRMTISVDHDMAFACRISGRVNQRAFVMRLANLVPDVWEIVYLRTKTGAPDEYAGFDAEVVTALD